MKNIPGGRPSLRVWVLQGWAFRFLTSLRRRDLFCDIVERGRLSTLTAVNIQRSETRRDNARQFLRNSERE